MNRQPSQPKVLLVCNDDARSSVLEDILRDCALLRIARNFSEFGVHMDSARYDVVFCAWAFQSGTWKDVLERTHAQHPDLPVVVFNHTGGEKEWSEVLRTGGFDLIVAPYWERGVLTVLEHAIATHDARRIHNPKASSHQSQNQPKIA